MELSVRNVMAVKSALEKKEGRAITIARHAYGDVYKSIDFVMDQAAGQTFAPPPSLRCDGFSFASSERPVCPAASPMAVPALHRHVLWVNDAVAKLYGVQKNKK